jgi:hypothetical protein
MNKKIQLIRKSSGLRHTQSGEYEIQKSRGLLWREVKMAEKLDSKQVVSFEELLMSQVVQQEAITRLLMEKGIFSKEEFLDMVREIDKEMKRKRKQVP